MSAGNEDQSGAEAQDVTAAQVRSADQHRWRVLAWAVLALIASNSIGGLIFAIWFVSGAFNQLDKTQRNAIGLVKDVQASNHAFASAQAKARQSFVSSQIALNRAEAEKNREEAQAARSQTALMLTQQATQRADARLADARALLADAQAKQAQALASGQALLASAQAKLASAQAAAQEAAARLANDRSVLANALAKLAAAQAKLALARAGGVARLLTAESRLGEAQAAAQRSATRVAESRAVAQQATTALISALNRANALLAQVQAPLGRSSLSSAMAHRR